MNISDIILDNFVEHEAGRNSVICDAVDCKARSKYSLLNFNLCSADHIPEIEPRKQMKALTKIIEKKDKLIVLMKGDGSVITNPLYDILLKDCDILIHERKVLVELILINLECKTV